MSLTPLLPSPRESATLVHINFFALLVMNGPLPAELKFRENTGFAISRLPSLCLEKRFCFGDIINPLLITKLALSIWMNVCLVHVYI